MMLKDKQVTKTNDTGR